MAEDMIRFPYEQSWDDQIAATTQLFREADQLDDAAYKVIESDPGSDAAWARFTCIKTRADAKRTAAYQEWMRIRRQMMKK